VTARKKKPTKPTVIVLRRKALSVQLSHAWSRATPLFDDERLVSYAGLVPVLALAEKAGLSELISAKVAIDPGRPGSRRQV
jgi:hypothetical protein